MFRRIHGAEPHRNCHMASTARQVPHPKCLTQCIGTSLPIMHGAFVTAHSPTNTGRTIRFHRLPPPTSHLPPWICSSITHGNSFLFSLPSSSVVHIAKAANGSLYGVETRRSTCIMLAGSWPPMMPMMFNGSTEVLLVLLRRANAVTTSRALPEDWAEDWSEDWPEGGTTELGLEVGVGVTPPTTCVLLGAIISGCTRRRVCRGKICAAWMAAVAMSIATWFMTGGREEEGEGRGNGRATKIPPIIKSKRRNIQRSVEGSKEETDLLIFHTEER